MKSLISRAIPPVSREFALELQKRFKPFDVKPGFERDELMQSVGEQRVINFIIHHSNNYTMKSTFETSGTQFLIKENSIIEDKIDELPSGNVEYIPNTDKQSIWNKFTTRFGI